MTPEEAEDFYEEDEPLENILLAWKRGRLCLVCCKRPIGWIWPGWLVRWHLKRVKRSWR